MKRTYFFLIVLMSLVVLGVNCKNTKNLPQNPKARASDGLNAEGEFLNPDANPLIYEPPAPKKPGKGEFFSHTQHGVDLPDEKRKADLKFKGKPITCSDCHNGECNPKKKSVDINRPGHDSCGGIKGCHPDFMSNQKICSSCHTKAPALRPYGSAQIVNVLDYGFDYDHSSHLGPKAQPSKRGKSEATCDSCHVEDKQGKNQTQAGHSQCGQCHCDDDAKVKMNNCVSCHTGTDTARSAHAYLDYRPHAQAFMHKDHRIDDKGSAVACKSCHVGVGESDSLLQVAVPPMLGCLQSCHDGSHKDSAGKQIFDGWVECSQCHEAGAVKGTAKSAKKKKKK